MAWKAISTTVDDRAANERANGWGTANTGGRDLGGIRRCLGAAFASLEIKTVLRTVLSTVELEPLGAPDRPRRRAVTMSPAHGTRVRVLGPARSPAQA